LRHLDRCGGATARSVLARRHDSLQHRDFDLDGLRRHHSRRSVCALDESIGAIGGGFLYRSADFALGRSLPVEQQGMTSTCSLLKCRSTSQTNKKRSARAASRECRSGNRPRQNRLARSIAANMSSCPKSRVPLDRHCERSDAIQSYRVLENMDCFVAGPVIGPATSGRTRWLLAMTRVRPRGPP